MQHVLAEDEGQLYCWIRGFPQLGVVKGCQHLLAVSRRITGLGFRIQGFKISGSGLRLWRSSKSHRYVVVRLVRNDIARWQDGKH